MNKEQEFNQLLEAEWSATLDEAGRHRLDQLCQGDSRLAERLARERQLSAMFERCGPNHAPADLANDVMTHLRGAEPGPMRRPWWGLAWRPQTLRWAFATAVIGVIAVQATVLVRQERGERMRMATRMSPQVPEAMVSSVAPEPRATYFHLFSTDGSVAGDFSGPSEKQRDFDADSPALAITGRITNGIVVDGPRKSGFVLAEAQNGPELPLNTGFPVAKEAKQKAIAALASPTPSQPMRSIDKGVHTSPTSAGAELVQRKILQDPRVALHITLASADGQDSAGSVSLGRNPGIPWNYNGGISGPITTPAFTDSPTNRQSKQRGRGDRPTLRNVEIAVAMVGGEILGSQPLKDRPRHRQVQCLMTQRQLGDFVRALQGMGLAPQRSSEVTTRTQDRLRRSKATTQLYHYKVLEGGPLLRPLVRRGGPTSNGPTADPLAARPRALKRIKVRLVIESKPAPSPAR